MSKTVEVDLGEVTKRFRALRVDLNSATDSGEFAESRIWDRALTKAAYAAAVGIHETYPWLDYEAFVLATTLIHGATVGSIDWHTDENWQAFKEDFRQSQEARDKELIQQDEEARA